jgi:hypothetical protein
MPRVALSVWLVVGSMAILRMVFRRSGGLAQNLSFIFGVKALLMIAVLIYGGATLLHVTGMRGERFPLQSELAT